MHTQTIYELSQEAERLLMLSLEHLRQLQKLPMTSLDDVALKQGEHSSQVVQPLHFSARGMDVQQATLNNELRKITRLEMVLAIYKSQKAGAPVKLPLQDFASTDMAGEFISGKA